MNALKPENLRCEYEVTPIGVSNANPLLSWETKSDVFNGRQTAYQIIAARSPENLFPDGTLIWNTGKVESGMSFAIPYEGECLKSSERIFWKVRIWDQDRVSSEWSDTSFFEMGLLNADDWHGHFMGFLGGMIGNGQMFRYAFELRQRPVWARAYVCVAGYYQLRINGNVIGNKLLDPGATDYSKTLLYSSYEVEKFLEEGLNVIGVVLGTGWAGAPKFLLQMNIRFEDGSTQEIFTDWGIGWNVARGPITMNSIYDGEDYDARLEKPGWDTPEYQSIARKENQRPGGWILGTMVENPGGKFVGEIMPPVRIEREIKPVFLRKLTDGRDLYDCGENIAGWAAIKVHGRRGSKVSMTFAEILDEQGNLELTYYRTARSMDTYILSGEGEESYEPIFTYHGFQYIAVKIEGEAYIDEITAKFAHSDVKDNCSFNCDNALLNKLQYTMKHTDACNLYSIPTDCCQRDERHGWATDTTARAEGSIYNFDMASFFDKWMRDILDSQSTDGYFADTAPFRWGRRPCDPQVNTPISLPLLLYQYYGNKQLLEKCYMPIHKYLQALLVESHDFMIARTGFGEWACPKDQCFDDPNEAAATNKYLSPEFVSTGYLYYSIRQMEQISHILGKKEERYYHTIGDVIREKFNKKYFNEKTERYDTGTQSADALAISLGIAPEDFIPAIVQNIVEDVKAHGYHVTTGSMGTKALFEVLSKYGQVDTAYKLMKTTTSPSFGYMLSKGATSIWERWEADDNNNIMNSHNQPMLSSAITWFYKYLVGIQIDGTGFSKIRIEPAIPTEMNYCKANVGTVLGDVCVSWVKTDETLEIEITIPFNSEAALIIDKREVKHTSGFVIPEGVGIKDSGGKYILETGSGHYKFSF